MITETVEITAQAYRDGTYGVNAKLATIPVYTSLGHETPPDVSEVVTTFDSDKVAHEEDPVNSPVLILAAGERFLLDGEPMTDHLDGRQGEVVTLYYTTEKNYSKALRHASYTLRAALWTLVDLFDPSRSGSEADREEHGIQLVGMERHFFYSTAIALDTGAITGTLTTTYQTRELLP